MKQSSEEIKKTVREKYAAIANQSKEENEQSCCGVGGSCATVDYAVFAEDYSKLKGYESDADLGLGCGIPTEFAGIKEGSTVLDLGSGAGNDCFVAREIVGEKGKVIGLDMTEAMIDKARDNADKLGFNNVEFRKGEIEKMPIGGNRVDTIISNCVLNLVPDKPKAFEEMFRVTKPGGNFCVSDVVLKGEMPEQLRQDAEMYVGCVSGAINIDLYLSHIADAGFRNIEVKKLREIDLPQELLAKFMDENKAKEFIESENGIYSVTVYAEKPACVPGSGCC
ncbi:arsenite S-adenosylmethyltransferase (plasmid) [Fulvitalea axinellae]|uniref:Arsenite methyltransferase n=1 Tax=Fulvitalea axinellae TaxID=1182444 RepID=A0AAU9CRG8_9BACT|nr:arsenite S-adenosylmethyltransferase [Fulvitalea axinellae]